MIAEILLVLAGHSSSFFTEDYHLHPAFETFLHPGEQQCLASLGSIAHRYRQVKTACSVLARSSSRYLCALCATLSQILKDDYESLIVDTESKILHRDASFVAGGAFVPLSAVRAVFSAWDAPLAALDGLLEKLQSQAEWPPGEIIDMLIARAATGTHLISDIMGSLARAVQRVWRTQLIALLVHGTLSTTDPLAESDYTLIGSQIPSCVSDQTRNSISYIGRALGTVKVARWQTQFPRELVAEHTRRLENVLVQDQYTFDNVIADIRVNVSEWLWRTVLTQKNVEEAIDSLADYFLLRDGEFSLSLIQEIERLKLSRLTARSNIIREQDLNLALLRASIGTSAQHDPALSCLRFSMPSGPLRSLLPTPANPRNLATSFTGASLSEITFDDFLLGTPLVLSYRVEWPLDLFLQPADLYLYALLFAYLSSLRKVHMRVHTCWTSLSNAQRARRRWTGLGEGGTVEDQEMRQRLLRCGWGIVHEMSWFLDNFFSYVMTDVVDVEFRRLKKLLASRQAQDTAPIAGWQRASSTTAPLSASKAVASGTRESQVTGLMGTAAPLDFTSLRNIHSAYLERLVVGCLLANPALTAIIRPIFELCEQFVAQVERWGGDVLPALLFEGSVAKGMDAVGEMVRERWAVVSGINETLRSLLESFYEQLAQSTSQQTFGGRGDASKSMLLNSTVNASLFGHTTSFRKDAKRWEGEGEARRQVERLLLRLDFNGEFTKASSGQSTGSSKDILREGGLM
ncbi:Spc98 family-domain-containing protein [Vararia minispora EC-137]|uniref:Spc98 family-domain-containing protein n=1 Tax=Vararia minispora EC-137 TaxID=1314806 RepID=A0ACB8QZ01_9AGAM|nr:Spc98 family-domain-containing protein [Vararia minispora EC-137]